MFTPNAPTRASDGAKSIGRLAAGVLFIHQPTQPTAIATGTSIATDATRSGEIARGKVEDRLRQQAADASQCGIHRT